MIYFIQDGGYVKIGYSDDVGRRLRALQTGNPRELRLIYSVTDPCGGWKFEESMLHEKFGHLRIRGEWDRYTWELESFINGLIMSDPARGDWMRDEQQDYAELGELVDTLAVRIHGLGK